MKSEAVFKSYICNGSVIATGNNVIFDRISKSPIYEVVRVLDGNPLFLDDHLDRMLKSGSLIGYDIGFSIDEIKLFASKCIKENSIANNNIKLMAVEDDCREKLFLVLAVESFYPPADYYDQGIKTVLFDYERENPNAKVQHGDYKERVKEAMDSTGSFEALLKNHEGYILEGSRSNMFYVIGRTVYTAPSKDVLLGITRKHIIKLCKNLGYRVEEKKLHTGELHLVDGMFISGTSIGVLPITYIEEFKLYSTKNEVVRHLFAAYDELVHKSLD